MPKIVAKKEDWLKLGYQLFSENGVLGLNVDKMSRSLKCNKSSFYWHFKTKKDFINTLVADWIRFDTTNIIEEINTIKAAKDKLIKLIEISYRKDANLDFIFYLKKYARTDKTLTKTIERIDAKRIRFVSKLLIDMGFGPKEAKLKSVLFYKHLIGHHELMRYKKQRQDYLPELLTEINQFININKTSA